MDSILPGTNQNRRKTIKTLSWNYHDMGPWVVIFTFQTKSRGVRPEHVGLSNPSINLAYFSTSVTNLSSLVLSLYGSMGCHIYLPN